MIKNNKINFNKKSILYILCLLFIIFLIIFFVSIKNIISWKNDSFNSDIVIKEQFEDTNILESDDNEKTEVIKPEKDIPKENPYWDYIKMKLISVDFKDLKKKNNDTVGWIQINGTNINYPFVQTNNNSFYLNHSFNKSKNNAGWVFMDYRNNSKNFNKNTIIYAHGRSDNTMFGSLKNILKSKWLDNPNNFIIKLSTEEENTLWQVFSVYKTPTTADYLAIDFLNKDVFLKFANKLVNRSQFNFNTSINENDKMLTLSTCYDSREKVVLHAKLIKRESN